MENQKENVIEDKLYKKIRRTKKNRMNHHLRMMKYHEKYNDTFFTLNIITVITVFISLAFKIPTAYNVLIGILSIYVIISQYYINQKNYYQRSTQSLYVYHSLDALLMEMKKIIEDHSRIHGIESEYRNILQLSENHSDFDDLIRENKENCNGKFMPKDWSFDNVYIYFNKFLTFITIIMIIYFFVKEVH